MFFVTFLSYFQYIIWSLYWKINTESNHIILCVYILICICIYMYMYICVYNCVLNIWFFIYECTYTHTCTHTHLDTSAEELQQQDGIYDLLTHHYGTWNMTWGWDCTWASSDLSALGHRKGIARIQLKQGLVNKFCEKISKWQPHKGELWTITCSTD